MPGGAVNRISAVPEFASSLAVSFGNPGIFAGTAVSGMVIATHCVAYTPWVGMAFSVAAIMRVWLLASLRTV
ncbi:hypothetical protein HF324_20105 [Chitinophaga oryzae]|uniref:Uncharacterized protein n=1 Tax=Chitinophaga oryzae TaxID=2725414 RepID=A0ABX6LIU7_9BACT|nr:hypothetical protein [Chitinophaga oryzae]QJB40037.2 hypothetical protein HF324_20105 [Chitinophaga oryzae]